MPTEEKEQRVKELLDVLVLATTEKRQKRQKVYKAYKGEYPIGAGGVLSSWRGNKLKGKIWNGKGALKAAFACWADENELDEIDVEEYELVLVRRVKAREIIEE